MTPLFLSLGKQQGVKVGEIIGMLYNESGVPQGSIGHVRLFPRNSRIEVKAEVADQIIESTWMALNPIADASSPPCAITHWPPAPITLPS